MEPQILQMPQFICHHLQNRIWPDLIICYEYDFLMQCREKRKIVCVCVCVCVRVCVYVCVCVCACASSPCALIHWYCVKLSPYGFQHGDSKLWVTQYSPYLVARLVSSPYCKLCRSIYRTCIFLSRALDCFMILWSASQVMLSPAVGSGEALHNDSMFTLHRDRACLLTLNSQLSASCVHHVSPCIIIECHQVPLKPFPIPRVLQL